MRYVIHFFDLHEHLRRSEAIECADDERAVAAAAASARSHPYVLEVWSGERRVWRFEAAERLAFAS